MTAMTPEEWRRTVGEAVQRRREHLYRSRRQAAEGSGISESAWRQMETGKRQVAPGVVLAPAPEPGTLNAMGARLGWDAAWLDALMRGDDPTEVAIRRRPTDEDQRFRDLEARLDRIELLLRDRLGDRDEQ